MRLFYQIYADGKFSEIFEIDPYFANEGRKLYGAFFSCLAEIGIKEFGEDSKQYVINLTNDIEVKISKFGTFGTKWIQVSATTLEGVKSVFEYLRKHVKKRLEALKEGDT